MLSFEVIARNEAIVPDVGRVTLEEKGNPREERNRFGYDSYAPTTRRVTVSRSGMVGSKAHSRAEGMRPTV